MLSSGIRQSRRMLLGNRGRGLSSSTVLSASTKKKHWLDEYKTSHTDRAMQHFDDFYASVYSSKWPSLRLGLLSPQKYVAVPNTFSNPEQVVQRLSGLGAYSLAALWMEGKKRITKDRQSIAVLPEDENTDKERLKELDDTLLSIAQTKVAEEMETLYQNAPEKKIPGIIRDVERKRVLGSIKEANAEFVTPTKLKGIEEFDFDSQYYSSAYPQSDEPSSIASSPHQFIKRTESLIELKLPLIQPYTFEAGSSSQFPVASLSRITGLRDWICVNGSSIAPIIALDLHPETNILDLCGGPGTKALLCHMTFCPVSICINDVENGRLARVKRLFREFVGTSDPPGVTYSRCNATNFVATSKYNRVLADVPCSSDRVSATVDENNLFKPQRIKERLGLIKIQKSILLSAFRALSSDSVCVYSTCTLSPVENDGVVGMALRETEIEGLVVDIEGLWNALVPFQNMQLMNLARTKFGVLIQPSIFSNFGPMFVSRILLRSSSSVEAKTK